MLKSATLVATHDAERSSQSRSSRSRRCQERTAAQARGAAAKSCQHATDHDAWREREGNVPKNVLITVCTCTRKQQIHFEIVTTADLMVHARTSEGCAGHEGPERKTMCLVCRRLRWPGKYVQNRRCGRAVSFPKPSATDPMKSARDMTTT